MASRKYSRGLSLWLVVLVLFLVCLLFVILLFFVFLTLFFFYYLLSRMPPFSYHRTIVTAYVINVVFLLPLRQGSIENLRTCQGKGKVCVHS